jgi:pimeloyl-ACP methyl ester carboxylesterase
MTSMTTLRTANRVLGTIAPTFTAGLARRLMMRPHVNQPRPWELPARETAEKITFRFGLGGYRWGSSGPTVLMMHGWQGRPTQFARFIEPLLASGRQVIALEAPAHGRSPGEEAHPVAFAEALLEAASEIRGLESVVGHSMGGSAAMIAVHRGLPVQRAVAIGSPSAMQTVLQRFANTVALPHGAQRRFFELVDKTVGVPASELDVARLGSELDIPGLVVHDRDDDMVPFEDGRAIAEHWRHARFIETSGLGHRQVLADPDVVHAVVSFLTENTLARAA